MGGPQAAQRRPFRCTFVRKQDQAEFGIEKFGLFSSASSQGLVDFSFGEDQGCTETDGKKGHKSGTVGDEPCCHITVQRP